MILVFGYACPRVRHGKSAMEQVTCRLAKYLSQSLLMEILLLFYYLYKLTSSCGQRVYHYQENTKPWGGGGLQRTKLLSENAEGIDRFDGTGVPVTAILM
jgi:hypothetical protein